MFQLGISFKSFYLDCSFHYFIVTLLISLDHSAMVLSADFSLHLRPNEVMLLPWVNILSQGKIFFSPGVNIFSQGEYIFYLVTAGDWQRGSSTQGHLQFNLLTLFFLWHFPIPLSHTSHQ